MYRYANNVFYPYALKQNYINAGVWPEVGIDVDESAFEKWTATPPMGKTRVVGDDGLPAWGEPPPAPPLTPEQLSQWVESQKRQLLKMATEKIDICQDAIDLDMATNAEKSSLTEWRKYRVLLNRVDCSTAPDIQWPEQPE
ncbi:tail fiber assembly protein [Xenorhabdus entomophaga]|uniref:tail fiber assembly protein n=1 Tax=Xenorhabdus entomophaga TaxID=3136257 RepID=UPI0030F45AAE